MCNNNRVTNYNFCFYFVPRQWHLGLVDNAPCRVIKNINSAEDKMTQLHEQLKTHQDR